MSVCETTPQPLPTTLLSLSLILGLIISYLPQHIRIIRSKSSEGFSPWYLLLGSTSAASGMVNVGMLEWGRLGCWRSLSPIPYFLSLLPLLQVSLVWFLFSLNLVLYLYYFPAGRKFVGVVELSESGINATNPGPRVEIGSGIEVEPDERTALLTSSHPAPNSEQINRLEDDMTKSVIRGETKVRLETTKEWRLAVVLAWVVGIHLILLLILSLSLLLTLPPTNPLLSTFPQTLGLLSTLLAVLQYAPQLLRTYKTKLVGALSIGTMGIQCPGSGLFVLSLVLAGRGGGGEGEGKGGGVDWSSWLTYAVSGVMQGALLVMCLAWKRRQRRLGQDDFGRPLVVETDEGHDSA